MIGTKATTDNLNIISAAITDRGLSEKRPQNEDSYLEMRAIGIFAVADGVGGAQAGEVASQMAVEILGEAFTNLQPGDDAETVMRSAMSKANAAIFQMAHELPQLSSMATTIAALHLNGNIATIGHVGDSRVYSVDQNGEITRLTDDHSVVAEEVRAGRMTEEQADNHPSKNVISRALGAEDSVEPDLITILVEPGTSFLLCSDGITRHVSDDEIRGSLAKRGVPQDVCQHFKNLCYERGAEDNLTAVIVSVSDNSAAKTDDTPVLQLEEEEATVTGARVSGNTASTDDDLLELNTRELPPLAPAIEAEQKPIEVDPPHATAAAAEPAIHESLSQQETVSNYEPPESVQSVASSEIPVQSQGGNLSIFSKSEVATEREKGSLLGKIASLLAMLLIGGVLGFGIYHFVLAQKPDDTNVDQLTEMRSANIPLSAFEENRRTVDKTPTEALARFGADPRDAEDYFLVGRANMLLGNYVEAKKAFTQSTALIASGDPEKFDPRNVKTLQTEIAIAMSVLSGTTVQTVFEKELSAISKPANANVNASANANTNSNR